MAKIAFASLVHAQSDYLTFGGIYCDVNLRVVPKIFIENVFARPADVLGPGRRVDVRVFLDESQATGGPFELTAELRDGSRVVATNSSAFTPDRKQHYDITLSNLGAIDLWSIDQPKLYDVRVHLSESGKVIDQYKTRIGFRDARFTPNGFF